MNTQAGWLVGWLATQCREAAAVAAAHHDIFFCDKSMSQDVAIHFVFYEQKATKPVSGPLLEEEHNLIKGPGLTGACPL